MKTIEVIYVELDVLLDTRLGTIARLDEEAASQLLLTGGYHEREVDTFAGIDMDAYRDLYKNRDSDTLAKSTVTDACAMIGKVVQEIAAKATVHPLLKGAKVVVNTYPYNLTAEEQVELGKVIETWIRPRKSEELNPESYQPIKLVSISPEELTPAYCEAENFAMMWVYEYDPWMSLHVKGFEHVRLNDVAMIAPAIYFGQKPTDQEMDDLRKHAAHPFHAVEILTRAFINLQLIPVTHFSVIRPQ